MKLAKKVILCIVGILVVIVGVVTIHQFDNLKVLYQSRNLTLEEAEANLQKNLELRKKAVEGIEVRELTEDERQALKSGDLNSTELLERITNSTTTGVGNGDPNVTKEQDYDAELAELIGQIYILEASFSGAVDGLINSAISEYQSLPPEMHTNAKKWEIGLKYLGVASSMEGSCDSQMASLLSKIESNLMASGKDTALLGDIKNAYQNEKTLTKNYYLSLYS